MFIAEKINEEVISHLFSVANRNSQVYKGKVRILPIDRKTFINLTESALSHPNFSNKVLLSYFDTMFSNEYSNMGELDWFELVKDRAAKLNLH